MQVSFNALYAVLLAATAAVILAPSEVAGDALWSLDDSCDCDVNADNSQTFKCGNDVYVCPGVERICSTQASRNSVFLPITQEQCDAMHAVEIGEKCVGLPEHGVSNPRALSNRVCYTDSGDGFNGYKNDGSCEECSASFLVTASPTASPVVVAAPDPSSSPTLSPTFIDPLVTPPTNPPTAEPTGPPTKTPTGPPTKTPTGPPKDASTPTNPPANPPGTKPDCDKDIKILKTTGVTPFPDGAIKIIQQNQGTVTVALSQQWEINVLRGVENIFYSYQTSRFSNQCFEKQDVAGATTYDGAVEIVCNVMTPVAHLSICVADGGGCLDASGDNATIPKCCQGEVRPTTPKVCYEIEIMCVPGCVDDDTATTTAALVNRNRRGLFLRGAY